ncbi:MAG: hypothetical protein DRP64_18165 [Verrucomicrobia bacterium]|nr:MAG: hypothetical protein DRP64_18165 [Verrucomicrobiota bacterium]
MENPEKDPPHCCSGKIPRCPEIEPGSTQGDGWCKDCVTSGDPAHHGGLTCYRSYGSGAKGGQQCCYDENGDLVTPEHKTLGKYAGTIDIDGGASGERPNKFPWGLAGGTTLWLDNPKGGCCTWNPIRALSHILLTDVPDSENCPDYDKVQECMRNGDYRSKAYPWAGQLVVPGAGYEPGVKIPSGDRSGPAGGVTQEELERAYSECKSKYGC